ncbi:MAG: Holliday junction resolvase RuvX [Acutalibacteraceae bacterium]|nr:Holliday junction resolvase RuvX [Acutalibacteraceae bacterium]HIR04066.1 Holliday junction resolvase RuvX [Candidatus Scatovicinus merdipullorum]
MVIMAVDLGAARTGLALCDKAEMLASPLGIIEEKDPAQLLVKVAEQAKAHKAEQIVVGLPKNMDGSEGASAQAAREFATFLHALTGIAVDMRDERGTTVSAHNYLNRTNTRGKKRKAVVDSVAATIILQDYLDSRRLHGENT